MWCHIIFHDSSNHGGTYYLRLSLARDDIIGPMTLIIMSHYVIMNGTKCLFMKEGYAVFNFRVFLKRKFDTYQPNGVNVVAGSLT